MITSEIQKISKEMSKDIVSKCKNVYKMNFVDIGMFADSLRMEIKKARK